MSKKVARTINYWGGGATRRRRRVRPHVLKAARNAFVLMLVGIPAGIYLFYCLCHLAGGAHVDPSWANGQYSPADKSLRGVVR